MAHDFSDILTNSLTIEWQESTGSLLIKHPNNGILVKIAKETIEAMSFNEAAEFVGARVLLTIPAMRGYFVDDSKETPEIIARP